MNLNFIENYYWSKKFEQYLAIQYIGICWKYIKIYWKSLLERKKSGYQYIQEYIKYIGNYYWREKSGWSLAISAGQTNCSTNPCQLITKSMSSYRKHPKLFPQNYLRIFPNEVIKTLFRFQFLSTVRCSLYLTLHPIPSNIIPSYPFQSTYQLIAPRCYIHLRCRFCIVCQDSYLQTGIKLFLFRTKLIRLQKHTVWPEF